LRRAEGDAPLSSDLPAGLFECDVSIRDLAFDDFTHAQSYVCEDAVLVRIEAAADGENFASDDSARSDYQIVVGWINERGGKRGVGRAK
jgi:hypothetical protein